MKKPLYTLLAVGVMRCYAQTVTPVVVASDGGFYSGAQGSVAWTIGEPVTETFVSGGGNITTMGFQQAELDLATLLHDQEKVNRFLVYPNPVRDLVKINFSGLRSGIYHLVVSDALGKQIYVSEVPISETQFFYEIPLSQFAAGAYFLNIRAEEFHETIKINKIN